MEHEFQYSSMFIDHRLPCLENSAVSSLKIAHTQKSTNDSTSFSYLGPWESQKCCLVDSQPFQNPKYSLFSSEAFDYYSRVYTDGQTNLREGVGAASGADSTSSLVSSSVANK